MLKHILFARPLLSTYQGERHTTITGRPITGNSKETIEGLLQDASYPLRFRLGILARSTAETMTKYGKDFADIIRAAGILRDEIHSTLLEWENYFGPQDDLDLNARKEEARREKADEDKNDEFGVSIGTYIRSTHRDWAISEDPQVVFECLYEFSELLKEGSPWAFPEVCGLLSLWCIDEAVGHIEANEPYKAALFALHAELYNQWLYDEERTTGDFAMDDFGILSAFSKRGLDVRHGPNREVKKKALDIYQSKDWPSQAEAARRIGATVNRTELVVMRWIREHRKNNNSTGSDGALPVQG